MALSHRIIAASASAILTAAVAACTPVQPGVGAPTADAGGATAAAFAATSAAPAALRATLAAPAASPSALPSVPAIPSATAAPLPTASPHASVTQRPTAGPPATGSPTAVPSGAGEAPAAQGVITPLPTVRIGSPTVPAATPVAQATAAGQGAAAGQADRRLAEGKWLQLIGDCVAARRTFADLIAAGPSPSVASEARYRMAQCYLRDQAHAEAATVLEELMAVAPAGDPFRDGATFLLGEALAALGDAPQAETAYRRYLPAAPEIASMVWQRIARQRLAQNDQAGAEEAYREALATSPDWTNTVNSRLGLAGSALERFDAATAVSQYDALRGEKTTGAWAAEMEYSAGVALARSGDLAGAEKRWRNAITADITSRHAHASVVALLDAGLPVDEYLRGVANYHNGGYQLAIAAFDRLRAADPAGRNGDAWYFSALSRLASDDLSGGLAELDRFISDYPQNTRWPDAWLAKGRALAGAQQLREAIDAYRRIADERPDSPAAPKALWQAAVQEERAGVSIAASDAYLDFARRYPKADEAWRAYQDAGLMAFMTGDFSRALAIWQEMAAAPGLPEFSRAVAFFWQGRALERLGLRDAALAAWKTAFERGPDAYYGMRAAERYADLAGGQLAGAEPPGIAPRTADPGLERAELSAWLEGWAGPGKLELPVEVINDGDWRRGVTLLELGQRTAALANFGRVQTRHAENPWTMAALAVAFRDLGANRLSLLSAESVIAKSGKPLREAPPSLQRLAYPLPYEQLIRQEAQKRGLDPRLLAAIIRQESRFEAGAASSAGAQGLMQVMPGTADSIAFQLNWQDFEPQQAYLPYVNVAFGAYYIDQWLDNFDGSLPAALASYNGGPGNARFWREAAPDDDDLMVALIGINETRVYIQTVSVQKEIYERLYPR